VGWGDPNLSLFARGRGVAYMGYSGGLGVWWWLENGAIAGVNFRCLDGGRTQKDWQGWHGRGRRALVWLPHSLRGCQRDYKVRFEGRQTRIVPV